MNIGQRPGLELVPAYKQGRAAKVVSQHSYKLSSNENPYEPLASVKAALERELGQINLYPDISAKALIQRLADRFSVSPENIALGAGSVEVASQLIHAVAGPGDEVIFAWRSFEAYPSLVRIAGAVPVEVPLDPEARHDLTMMADAVTSKTRLIFICNPNNPTGTTVSTDELDVFLTKVPANVLVVIDEAYLHFNLDPTTAVGIDFYRRYPNIAVLHTFSKAYGLAGLRLGYAIADPEVIGNLRKVAVPFAVTSLAQAAGIASLDAEHELQERIDQLTKNRSALIEQLKRAGLHVGPSEGNFVWAATGPDTLRISAYLEGAGVTVRAFPGEGMRISVGTPEATAAAVAAIELALAEDDRSAAALM
ncbi:histidinol-phosphate transaminase [Arthrobacter sp. R3-55]